MTWYMHPIATKRYFLHIVMMGISSQCDDKDMFFTLSQQGHGHCIATTWSFSSHWDDTIFASYCDDMIFASHCDGFIFESHCNEDAMLIKMWRKGYVCHIAMTRLWSSHYKDRIFASYCDNMIFASHCGDMKFTSHCEDEALFITLLWQGYVHHIETRRLCSSNCYDKAIFFTLRWQGYDLNIAMTRVFSKHNNDKAMFYA